MTPRRILTVKPEAVLNIALANHQDREVAVKLIARVEGPGKASLSWTQETVQIKPESTHTPSIFVKTPESSRRADYTVTVTAISGNTELGRGESAIIRFPASKNLLTDSNVEIRVDSTFAGYSTTPLRDGIIDTAGLSWSESAWASADIAVPHWVEARWPTPRRISSVMVHWAEDNGTYFRSNHYRLQCLSNGRWSDVADTKHEAPGSVSTRHVFKPLVADAIRILQESGGGENSRPNLLWIRELEVRDD